MSRSFKSNNHLQVIVNRTPNMSVPRGNKDTFAPPPVEPTLKIIVGQDETTQRIWHLPQSLLTKHSTYFGTLCSENNLPEHTMSDTDTPDFANFVDFMRSSIYSVNKNVADFRTIETHTRAYILGQRLGAIGYSNAALRSLHEIFKSLACSRESNRSVSCIRMEDIEFVSAQNDFCHGLKRLFYDAVAAHWTQLEVLEVKTMVGAGGTVGWAAVWKKCPDFGEVLAGSSRTPDCWRVALLKSAKHYQHCKVTAVGKQIKTAGGDEVGGNEGQGSASVPRRGFGLTNLLRSMSSSRRDSRMKAQVGEEDEEWVAVD